MWAIWILSFDIQLAISVSQICALVVISKDPTLKLHNLSRVYLLQLLQLQAATVTTQSSSRAEQLAKRLNEAGAKMYGAFWCSHCHEQKESFGSQAMKDFPYVECYPDGFHKVSYDICSTKNLHQG